MAINRTSPKKGKVVDIPTAPTIGTATAGPESATVAFTAATIGGPATTYTALSNPGSITGTGSSSPVTVTGLTTGTTYTFTVRGNNATGSSEYGSVSNSVVPTVGTAYESIQTVVVGAGGSTTVSFTSIPSTFKHLQIRSLTLFEQADRGSLIRFNSDSSNNYSWHRLFGNGTSPTADGAATQGYGLAAPTGAPSTSNTPGSGIIDILDYANTNKFKTVRSLNGTDANGNGSVFLQSTLWQSSSAITSITFTAGNDSKYNQYTHFALYGIRG